MRTWNTTSRTAGLAALAAGIVLLTPTPSPAGDAAAGKAKYDIFCASCHGAEGKGDGVAAAAAASMGSPPRDFSTGDFKFDTDGDGTPGSDTDLRNVVAHGAQKYGGNQMMAAWGGTLQDADLDNIVAYIRSLKK